MWDACNSSQLSYCLLHLQMQDLLEVIAHRLQKYFEAPDKGIVPFLYCKRSFVLLAFEALTSAAFRFIEMDGGHGAREYLTVFALGCMWFILDLDVLAEAENEGGYSKSAPHPFPLLSCSLLQLS